MLLVVALLVEAQAAESTNILSRIRPPIHQDLSRAYGFCLGQSNSLSKIEREFPPLAPDVEKARREFDLVFGPAFINIGKHLQDILKEKWTEYESQLSAQIGKAISSTAVNKDQAQAFLGNVLERSKGKIDSPIVEMLLSYQPEFQKDPTSEFARGFRKTFRTKDHPKAKGLDFQVEYPQSWTNEEGIRLDVVQFLRSANGRGAACAIVGMKNLAQEAKGALSDKDLKQIEQLETPQGCKSAAVELFTDSSLKEMAAGMGAANVNVLDTRQLVIDRWPGAMVEFTGESQRLDVTLTTFTRMYVVLYKRHLVFLHCQVAKLSKDTEDDFKIRVSIHKPLFWLMANSIVLHGKADEPKAGNAADKALGQEHSPSKTGELKAENTSGEYEVFVSKEFLFSAQHPKNWTKAAKIHPETVFRVESEGGDDFSVSAIRKPEFLTVTAREVAENMRDHKEAIIATMRRAYPGAQMIESGITTLSSQPAFYYVADAPISAAGTEVVMRIYQIQTTYKDVNYSLTFRTLKQFYDEYLPKIKTMALAFQLIKIGEMNERKGLTN